MDLMIAILCIVAIGFLGFIVLNTINILQAGSKRPDGRTMEQILGIDPEQAAFEDVEKLSREDKMQLFYAAAVPDLNALRGEYVAKMLSGGILSGSSAYFSNHIFPTGKLTLKTKWSGKAFQPEDADNGSGYNLFVDTSRGSTRIIRTRKTRTRVAPTRLGKDGKLSFHVDYSEFNSGLIHSMRDEIRMI